MRKKILVTASIFGIMAVILGAFGAHALKKILTEAQQVSFETGVRYQMYHALVLLFLGTTKVLSETAKKWLWYCFLIGVLLFSGSIYFLATNDYTAFDFKTIALLTPLGGVFLIVGWLILMIKFLKNKVD